MRKHRWMAGLLMSAGMVLSLGMLTSAPGSAQTASTTPNTSANTTATTVATTVAGGGGVGGTTLAHTGTDSALPLEVAGGLLTLAVAGTALVKKSRQS